MPTSKTSSDAGANLGAAHPAHPTSVTSGAAVPPPEQLPTSASAVNSQPPAAYLPVGASSPSPAPAGEPGRMPKDGQGTPYAEGELEELAKEQNKAE